MILETTILLKKWEVNKRYLCQDLVDVIQEYLYHPLMKQCWNILRRKHVKLTKLLHTSNSKKRSLALELAKVKQEDDILRDFSRERLVLMKKIYTLDKDWSGAQVLAAAEENTLHSLNTTYKNVNFSYVRADKAIGRKRQLLLASNSQTEKQIEKLVRLRKQILDQAKTLRTIKDDFDIHYKVFKYGITLDV